MSADIPDDIQKVPEYVPDIPDDIQKVPEYVRPGPSDLPDIPEGLANPSLPRRTGSSQVDDAPFRTQLEQWRAEKKTVRSTLLPTTLGRATTLRSGGQALNSAVILVPHGVFEAVSQR
jgi:hypothetical protein